MTLTLATSEAFEYFSNQEYRSFISVEAVRSAVLMAASRYNWLMTHPVSDIQTVCHEATHRLLQVFEHTGLALGINGFEFSV